MLSLLEASHPADKQFKTPVLSLSRRGATEPGWGCSISEQGERRAQTWYLWLCQPVVPPGLWQEEGEGQECRGGDMESSREGQRVKQGELPAVVAAEITVQPSRCGK